MARHKVTEVEPKSNESNVVNEVGESEVQKTVQKTVSKLRPIECEHVDEEIIGKDGATTYKPRISPGVPAVGLPREGSGVYMPVILKASWVRAPSTSFSSSPPPSSPLAPYFGRDRNGDSCDSHRLDFGDDDQVQVLNGENPFHFLSDVRLNPDNGMGIPFDCDKISLSYDDMSDEVRVYSEKAENVDEFLGSLKAADFDERGRKYINFFERLKLKQNLKLTFFNKVLFKQVSEMCLCCVFRKYGYEVGLRYIRYAQGNSEEGRFRELSNAYIRGYKCYENSTYLQSTLYGTASCESYDFRASHDSGSVWGKSSRKDNNIHDRSGSDLPSYSSFLQTRRYVNPKLNQPGFKRSVKISESEILEYPMRMAEQARRYLKSPDDYRLLRPTDCFERIIRTVEFKHIVANKIVHYDWKCKRYMGILPENTEPSLQTYHILLVSHLYKRALFVVETILCSFDSFFSRDDSRFATGAVRIAGSIVLCEMNDMDERLREFRERQVSEVRDRDTVNNSRVNVWKFLISLFDLVSSRKSDDRIDYHHSFYPGLLCGEEFVHYLMSLSKAAVSSEKIEWEKNAPKLQDILFALSKYYLKVVSPFELVGDTDIIALMSKSLDDGLRSKDSSDSVECNMKKNHRNCSETLGDALEVLNQAVNVFQLLDNSSNLRSERDTGAGDHCCDATSNKDEFVGSSCDADNGVSVSDAINSRCFSSDQNDKTYVRTYLRNLYETCSPIASKYPHQNEILGKSEDSPEGCSAGANAENSIPDTKSYFFTVLDNYSPYWSEVAPDIGEFCGYSVGRRSGVLLYDLIDRFQFDIFEMHGMTEFNLSNFPFTRLKVEGSSNSVHETDGWSVTREFTIFGQDSQEESHTFLDFLDKLVFSAECVVDGFKFLCLHAPKNVAEWSLSCLIEMLSDPVHQDTRIWSTEDLDYYADKVSFDFEMHIDFLEIAAAIQNNDVSLTGFFREFEFVLCYLSQDEGDLNPLSAFSVKFSIVESDGLDRLWKLVIYGLFALEISESDLNKYLAHYLIVFPKFVRQGNKATHRCDAGDGSNFSKDSNSDLHSYHRKFLMPRICGGWPSEFFAASHFGAHHVALLESVGKHVEFCLENSMYYGGESESHEDDHHKSVDNDSPAALSGRLLREMDTLKDGEWVSRLLSEDSPAVLGRPLDELWAESTSDSNPSTCPGDELEMGCTEMSKHAMDEFLCFTDQCARILRSQLRYRRSCKELDFCSFGMKAGKQSWMQPTATEMDKNSHRAMLFLQVLDRVGWITETFLPHFRLSFDLLKAFLRESEFDIVNSLKTQSPNSPLTQGNHCQFTLHQNIDLLRPYLTLCQEVSEESARLEMMLVSEIFATKCLKGSYKHIVKSYDWARVKYRAIRLRYEAPVSESVADYTERVNALRRGLFHKNIETYLEQYQGEDFQSILEYLPRNFGKLKRFEFLLGDDISLKNMASSVSFHLSRGSLSSEKTIYLNPMHSFLERYSSLLLNLSDSTSHYDLWMRIVRSIYSQAVHLNLTLEGEKVYSSLNVNLAAIIPYNSDTSASGSLSSETAQRSVDDSSDDGMLSMCSKSVQDCFLVFLQVTYDLDDFYSFIQENQQSSAASTSSSLSGFKVVVEDHFRGKFYHLDTLLGLGHSLVALVSELMIHAEIHSWGVVFNFDDYKDEADLWGELEMNRRETVFFELLCFAYRFTYSFGGVCCADMRYYMKMNVSLYRVECVGADTAGKDDDIQGVNWMWRVDCTEGDDVNGMFVMKKVSEPDALSGTEGQTRLMSRKKFFKNFRATLEVLDIKVQDPRIKSAFSSWFHQDKDAFKRYVFAGIAPRLERMLFPPTETLYFGYD